MLIALGSTSAFSAAGFPMVYNTTILNEHPFLLIFRHATRKWVGLEKHFFLFKISFPWAFQWYDMTILSEHPFLLIFGVGQEVGGARQNILFLKHYPSGR